MALLPILKYPDERLNKVAEPVTVFDGDLKQLAADMAETMYEAPGVGLAATQVNKHIQLIVIDVSETKDQLQVFVNPKVTEVSDEIKCWEEGCLSLPGIYEKVKRPAAVTVVAQDLDGNTFETKCDELLAVCIQHEMDHLKGKVFVDYLSHLKKSRITHKLQKQKLEEAKKAKEEAAKAS
ncbi:MAG: peptide deformylase [Burkholderiales bacterium]|nr:peptide deformylase [Burkholderiales bacterium]